MSASLWVFWTVSWAAMAYVVGGWEMVGWAVAGFCAGVAAARLQAAVGDGA